MSDKTESYSVIDSSPTAMAFPLLTVAAVAVALRLLWSLVSRWQHAQNARRLGCGSTPLYPSDPLGISVTREALAADKVKKILPMIERRVALMSDREGRYVTTFRIRQTGREMYFTTDPKNIQAVLATQFKDFELGAPRRQAVHSLLGTGIVGCFDQMCRVVHANKLCVV